MYVISKSDLLSNNMNKFSLVYFFLNIRFGKNLYFENFSVKSCNTDTIAIYQYIGCFSKIKPKTRQNCDIL